MTAALILLAVTAALVAWDLVRDHELHEELRRRRARARARARPPVSPPPSHVRRIARPPCARQTEEELDR